MHSFSISNVFRFSNVFRVNDGLVYIMILVT